MPAAVQDVGQRTQPNLEVLHTLRPDLILAIQDHDLILLASFIDPRHLSIYGAGSILHDALERRGKSAAFASASAAWGAAPTAQCGGNEM